MAQISNVAPQQSYIHPDDTFSIKSSIEKLGEFRE